ncbi:hypothetical protein [Bacillus cereus group sp. BfR-BA-01382]|uniref:hypothetical protein n=1 Tax=Bacillus cereus group sp. BfR-BA-01382 TaxID=2920326 RepID=UPI001F56EE8D
MNLEDMKELIKQNAVKKKQSFTEVEEPWDTITLYHGTTTKRLNEILQHGITPRNKNEINNFIDVPSNPELVYLSTKWHYWYAFHANEKSLINQVGKERYEAESITSLWNETGDFPVYIVCEVPKELLVLDEDVVYQWGIKTKIRSGEIQGPDDISVEECLQQGTIASLDTILPEYMNEVIIIGSEDYRDELLDGAYGVEAEKWFHGFGIGSLTADSLSVHEIMKYSKLLHILSVEPIPEQNKSIKRIYIEDEELQVEFE